MKYGAIVKSRITIPGDERSRTNPGHGYPEHDEETIRLHEFDTMDQLKTWIAANHTTNYRAIQYDELKVETRLVVELKPVEKRSIG